MPDSIRVENRGAATPQLLSHDRLPAGNTAGDPYH
jgi:hypothetical protein